MSELIIDQKIKEAQEASEKAKKIEEETKLQAEQEFETAKIKFKEDESYFPDFEGCDPIGKEVLVKIFKFQVSEDLASKGFFGKEILLVPSKLNGEWVSKTQEKYNRYFPFVKVIKKGNFEELKNIKIGELYIVPSDDVVGDEWNPEFMHLMNTFGKADGKMGVVHTPHEIPQKLQKIEVHWSRYKFSNPKSAKDDGLYYLLPYSKIKTPLLL